MRVVYGTPSRDVNRGVVVGVVRVSTEQAEELVLGLPVSFFAVTTNGTRPGRVSRIDCYDRDPRQLRLVGQKGTKLEEGPVGQPRPLLPPNRFLDPGSNPAEVCHGDPQPECLCFGNDLFRDAVVLLFLESEVNVGGRHFSAA